MSRKFKRSTKYAGNCYEVAAKAVLDDPTRRLILAHGTCTGYGPIKGVAYGHAWTELGGIVQERSNGNDLCVIRELYYAVGKCRSIHYYTQAEARRMVCKTGHWGPWDKDSEETFKQLLTRTKPVGKVRGVKRP
jgi:hypothetical protein